MSPESRHDGPSPPHHRLCLVHSTRLSASWAHGEDTRRRCLCLGALQWHLLPPATWVLFTVQRGPLNNRIATVIRGQAMHSCVHARELTSAPAAPVARSDGSRACHLHQPPAVAPVSVSLSVTVATCSAKPQRRHRRPAPSADVVSTTEASTWPRRIRAAALLRCTEVVE